MDSQKKAPTTIDEYVAQFPADIQKKLQEIRSLIHELAPEAQEKISYQMPAFAQNGILVYFAAFKDHLSLFPTSSGVSVFKEDLAPYKVSKGTIQFPLDQPTPLDLIKKIVLFRVEENRQKLESKKNEKKK
jgi:uncharacterized protein YdhG (YjbR/CyaY superfamily)